MESYTVMEKTYDVSGSQRFKTLLTYDLPVHLAFRFDSQYCMNISRIGHDEHLDLEKSKTFVTITNNAGKTLMTNREIGLELYTPDTFPSQWDTIVVKVHVPGAGQSNPSNMEIDFNNHDCVLFIGDEKFHVNSALLSMWSEYFATLFKGTCAEKFKHGFPVSDVDSKEFMELMKIIYPTRKDIDKDNVVFIWKLATRFAMPIVSQMCENYLTTLPGKYMVPLAQKYELAFFVKSEKLMGDCLALLANMSLGKVPDS